MPPDIGTTIDVRPAADFAPAACVAERTCCEIVSRYGAYRFLFHAIDNGF
jgi:hypothetical protein